MRENADQNNYKYGHLSRSKCAKKYDWNGKLVETNNCMFKTDKKKAASVSLLFHNGGLYHIETSTLISKW